MKFLKSKKIETPDNAKKRPRQRRLMRRGGYSIALCALAAAIVLAINLIFGELPSSATKPDLSAQQLYSISQQTEELLASLEKDVTIYLVAQKGNEDHTLQELLEKYESPRIHVETRDPVVNPRFTAQYTQDSVPENSLIVVCGERSKVIDYNEIFEYDYTYYYTTGSAESYFDGEGEITSAINYVTSDDLAKLYVLSGHGEQALSSTFESYVGKENIELLTLNLLTEANVPEDADCLLINGPTSDISAAEAEKIAEYLKGGGNMMLVSAYSDEERPNLAGLMAYYGASLQKGIMVESDPSHSMSGYGHYLVPNVQSHDITAPLMESNAYILAPLAQGIVTEARDNITATSLLRTSERSYSKLAGSQLTTMEKESGDVDGPFDVGIAITEKYGDTESKIVWFSSSLMFTDEVNSLVSGANSDLFLNSLGWMCGQESSIAIHPKSMSAQTLIITTGEANFWKYLLMIGVPVLALAAGLIIWLRRRRRA